MKLTWFSLGLSLQPDAQPSNETKNSLRMKPNTSKGERKGLHSCTCPRGQLSFEQGGRSVFVVWGKSRGHHDILWYKRNGKQLGTNSSVCKQKGVAGGTYTPHTLGPLEELGLDTHTATKLALKLHAHSVQYADIHASTRRALDKTPLNSHHRDQARAIASNPSDPH
eukprot:1155278-Pelagomonas_calceolata.AAC.2